ncbi:hypothetical protein I5N18_16420 [Serratia marcescens]|uniref:hypothetical protein n=1 Tax=Serratia sp. CY85266 TaxID=3383697 RepID=UPI0018D84D66|nr:hypothetical protein [Serratia marcescens]
MSEFTPVSTMDELAQLNDEEIIDGYRSGCNGAPEPDSTKSKSFWHGYRNGLVDSGRRKSDEHQTALARDCIAHGIFKPRH